MTKQYQVAPGWAGAGSYAPGDVIDETDENKAQIAHFVKMGAVCEYDAEAEAAKAKAAVVAPSGEAPLSASGEGHAQAIADLRAQVAAMEAKYGGKGEKEDTTPPSSPALTTGDDKIAEIPKAWGKK